MRVANLKLTFSLNLAARSTRQTLGVLPSDQYSISTSTEVALGLRARNRMGGSISAEFAWAGTAGIES